MSQGIAWDKEKVIEVLKPYLQVGCSVTKACAYAGIPQPTVATWVMNDPELQLKFNAWQNEVSFQARKNVADKVNLTKDSGVSKWWLEKKESDEFAGRNIQDVTVKDPQERLKEILDRVNEDNTPENG